MKGGDDSGGGNGGTGGGGGEQCVYKPSADKHLSVLDSYTQKLKRVMSLFRLVMASAQLSGSPLKWLQPLS